jgi:hypothetical protein
VGVDAVKELRDGYAYLLVLISFDPLKPNPEDL